MGLQGRFFSAHFFILYLFFRRGFLYLLLPLAALIVFMNLLTDILYKVVDPRITLSAKED